jgi:methyl-accepting chemotaxis protein
MDDILEATKIIAQEIQAIDKIAFQTNILSLNAAVEAATAGEAGKGFAVVAAEVRNLATKSANTASQIKSMVEQAQIKAENGKKVTRDMLNGYNILNNKIGETYTIIKEVEIASKEQRQGISQINDAVTQLDQMTQQNALTANSISSYSQKISNMASNLKELVSSVQFNKSVSNQICNVNMSFETAALKLDHVLFKDSNFSKTGNGNNWKVVNEHECKLGKWIDSNKHKGFTTSTQWQELLKVHADLHSGVQDYINIDSKNAYDNKLYLVANNIDNNTEKVFKLIDKLKEIDCKNSNNNSVNLQQVNKKISNKIITTKPVESNDDNEWDSF